jgi:hypothetical protein
LKHGRVEFGDTWSRAERKAWEAAVKRVSASMPGSQTDSHMPMTVSASEPVQTKSWKRKGLEDGERRKRLGWHLRIKPIKPAH